VRAALQHAEKLEADAAAAAEHAAETAAGQAERIAQLEHELHAVETRCTRLLLQAQEAREAGAVVAPEAHRQHTLTDIHTHPHIQAHVLSCLSRGPYHASNVCYCCLPSDHPHAAIEARAAADAADVAATAAQALADERSAELRVAQDCLRTMRQECNESWVCVASSVIVIVVINIALW
jgi:hypothetical protein